jgi:hypothetical protein
VGVWVAELLSRELGVRLGTGDPETVVLRRPLEWEVVLSRGESAAAHCQICCSAGGDFRFPGSALGQVLEIAPSPLTLLFLSLSDVRSYFWI